MNQRILKRFILPNLRGTRPNCEVCNLKFQYISKKEHQCKRCLRSVCEDCGPSRQMVYDGDGSSSLHRCCKFCLEEIKIINKYLTECKLSFGQNSGFVEDWVSKLNKERLSYDSIFEEYSDSVTGTTNQNITQFKSESELLFADLLDSYNYSLRHFVKVITEDQTKVMFETKVINVMVAIYGRVKALPYVRELIYLVVFFLCFANEAYTYFIITRMIEKIYPNYVQVNRMKRDNMLSSYLKTILEMYKICVDEIKVNEPEVIVKYLESRFHIYILSFTLNVCSLPCSFFIINEMLHSGTCEPLYKGIAAMIFYCREQIASYKQFEEVEIPILRSIDVDKMRACFKKFEKADAKFEVNNERYESTEHRKWHEKYKQIESLHERSEKILAEKEAKIKDLLADLKEKRKQIELLNNENQELKIQKLKLSGALPRLLNFQEMEEKYSVVMARNKHVEEKCADLESAMEKMEKERSKDERYRRNWAKMEEDYIQTIVELKTRCEIMEIQVSAKEIDFNTSYIDRKLREKNQQASLLREEIAHLKSELDFYKLKVLEKSYSLKAANQNEASKMKTDYEAKEKQFEQHIQNSNQIVQILTREKEQLKQVCTQHEESIRQLRELNEAQEQKIKDTQELSKIINETPQYYNFLQSLEQIKRVAEKETNYFKKETLLSLMRSFQKCYKQLRFRTIDCRIKEEKIKEMQQLHAKSEPTARSRLPSASEKPVNDNILEVLQHIEADKIDGASSKQCSVM